MESLKKYTKGYCFCVMKVNKKMMVIHVSKHNCVRKSILLVMHRMNRLVLHIQSAKHDLYSVLLMLVSLYLVLGW